jgi:ubiquinone/menaquinone biosynthesis C-methylase UbiE
MRWFRSGPSPFQTALAMVGAKPGQLVLVIGAGSGQLAAEIALVTGLNGRTVVVSRERDAERTVEAAAARAGALVEFEAIASSTLAAAGDTVDIVVLQRQLGDSDIDRAALASEAVRVLRPGGRVIVIEGAEPGTKPGLGRRPPAPAVDAATIQSLLAETGLKATRVLGEAEGTLYIEGVKPRVV